MRATQPVSYLDQGIRTSRLLTSPNTHGEALQAPGTRLRMPGIMPQAPGSGLQAPGSRHIDKIQAQDLRLRVSGQGLRLEAYGLVAS